MSNRLVYEDYAVGALELAKCTETGTTQLMSVESGKVVDRYNVDSIFQNESAYQCASFDNSGIKLTEPFHIMNASDDSGDQVGFVSAEISDASGTFTSTQQIQIEFLDENENVTVHTGNGVSLWFNTHYCKRVSVSYFDPEDNQVATYTYDNISSLYTFLSGRAVGYSKVIVAFLETERPFQRAMVSKFRFGRTVEIDQFKSISFKKKLDFYGADIAINSLDVAFYSEEELHLNERQKLSLYQVLNQTCFRTAFAEPEPVPQPQPIPVQPPAPVVAAAPAVPTDGSVFCTNCGNRVPAGSKFCNACGAPIVAPSTPMPVQPADVPVAVEQAAQTAPSAFEFCGKTFDLAQLYDEANGDSLKMMCKIDSNFTFKELMKRKFAEQQTLRKAVDSYVKARKG